MPKWIGVITNDGNDLLSEWANEKTLNFDKVIFGTDTVATEAMMAQSDLVSQKQVAGIVGSERVDSGIRLKIQITAADVSYVLNQIGVWASVEDAEPVMLALYQYTTGVPVPSKAESPEFVYTFYALISTSNQGQWTVNVDTSALVTREQLDSHTENLQLKKAVCEATPDTLAAIIVNAQPNTTINLTAGTYPLLLLSGKESFPDNLTIVGGTDVYMAGVSITSGLQAYASIRQTTNSDIAMATMSKNLTFKDITFTSPFCVRNCDITGLAIQECTYSEGACFQLVPNKTRDYHGDDGNGSPDIVPYYATRRAHNTIIKRCTFINANITNDTTTAIYAASVDGITIHKNVIEGAAWNGIQLNGSYQANLYDALSTGRIAITNNTIRNTGSRSMRLDRFENADIYITHNSLYSADQAESNGIERIKITNYDSTTKVIVETNTYDDTTIDVGNGITLSQNQTAIETSLTTVQTSLQRHIDAVNPHGMTADKIGAAPAGYGLGKEVGHSCSGDPNTATLSGIYTLGDNPINIPTEYPNFKWGTLLVDRRYTLINQTLKYNYITAVRTGSSADGGESWSWSPWEYDNPVLALGVEYRTTERSEGKPVYVKRISVTSEDISVLNDGTNIYFNHGISGFARLVRCHAVMDSAFPLPHISYRGSGNPSIISINNVNVTNIAITAINIERTALSFVFDIAYCKNN